MGESKSSMSLRSEAGLRHHVFQVAESYVVTSKCLGSVFPIALERGASFSIETETGEPLVFSGRSARVL